MLISFVCTGNICRSPSAALIAKKYFTQAGLSDVVIESAGTHGYHIGEPAHHHVQAVLAQRGYTTHHKARKIGEPERKADLIIAATTDHQDTLIEWGIAPEKIRLLRSFDESAYSHELADPYYLTFDAYVQMVDQIESAMPGIVQWALDHANSTY